MMLNEKDVMYDETVTIKTLDDFQKRQKDERISMKNNIAS